MKKGFKECPFCANLIKEGAIKCQYCKEFLDNGNSSGFSNVSGNGKVKTVNKVKKRNKRRKWGLGLLLILPATGVLWLLISLIFWLISGPSYTTTSGVYYGSGSASLIVTIRSFINWLLGIVSIVGLLGIIPGIILLVKPDSDYNPNIKLKTNQFLLSEIYKLFDISFLPNSDKQNMKHNGFIKKFNLTWAVILNILTVGTFSTFYYGIKHEDLPKIKYDDFSAGKAIGFLFIPFFNVYRIFVFWLRLVDRINFQYTLRGCEKPISRGLTIAFLVTSSIPYVNLVSIFILESILVCQIQNAINTLVDEK